MFQFKQFTIHQDRCAMKVTEVACLLGALTRVTGRKRALDIGSGTGLLSLMLAQRSPNLLIDAIELDTDAFQQGKENIASSPFHVRIQCFEGNVFSYQPNIRYELIICNPPFFEKQLLSSNEKKNRAWHSSDFSLEELWKCFHDLLSQDGIISIMIPDTRLNEVVHLNEINGFYLNKTVSVFHRNEMDTGLRILEISRVQTITENQIFILRNTHGYTEEALQLFKEFYLKL